MRGITTFILAAISAYTFSFSLDLLFGAMGGVYPSTAYLPVVTWSLISALLLIIDLKIKRRKLYIWFPFVLVGLLAILGGIVGSHPHNYLVGVVLLAEAAIIVMFTANTI